MLLILVVILVTSGRWFRTRHFNVFYYIHNFLFGPFFLLLVFHPIRYLIERRSFSYACAFMACYYMAVESSKNRSTGGIINQAEKDSRFDRFSLRYQTTLGCGFPSLFWLTWPTGFSASLSDVGQRASSKPFITNQPMFWNSSSNVTGSVNLNQDR